MRRTSRVTQLNSQQPKLPNFENCYMARKRLIANCPDAKTYWRQSVSAPKLIGAKKVGAKIFRDETSRRQNIGAKTLQPKLWRQGAGAKASAPKRSNHTLLISKQIRGTKLPTEKKSLTNDIDL